MEHNWGIIGHENIVKFLKNSLVKNRLANTYLFYGISGLGKAVLAERFAQEIVGENQSTELYPLVSEEGKKDIGIDQVRQWRRALSLKSFSSGNYKAGIIYQAEKLNEQSANALLKTIEEPPAKTIIIIVASEWQRLPETILSRCVKIRFLPVPSGEIRKSLFQKVGDKKKLEQIVALSNGRPGTAGLLAADEALLEKYLKYQKLIEKLFRVDVNQRWQVIGSLLDSLEGLQLKAKAAMAFLNHFEAAARRLMLADWQIGQAEGIKASQAIKLLKLASISRRDLSGNVQPKLVLENLLINL